VANASINYPTKAAIARALDAAAASGAKVSGYEIGPGGTIRVLFDVAGSKPMSAYDEWKAKKAGRA